MSITTHEIVIQIDVQSRNTFDRLHWAAKRRIRQEYELLIRNKMRLGKVPLAEEKKYKMVITSSRKRLLDLSNLYGGIKQLEDALCNEKFIWDDAPKYLDLEVIQVLGEPRTIIRREG